MDGYLTINPKPQLARERLALKTLGGAGDPYLPVLVAFGVETITGVPALLTEMKGGPLHQFMAWHRGERMAPNHVLLLSACLASACYSLMVCYIFHNTSNQHYPIITASCLHFRLTLILLTLHLQVSGIHHNDIRPDNITVSYSPEPSACLYHLVDLGMASCLDLNSQAFRSEWGFTGFGTDLALLSPVCDLFFGSVESLEVGT